VQDRNGLSLAAYQKLQVVVRRATATITPISALGSPIVKESAPALPDARASTTSPMPTWVLENSSGILGLTLNNIPTIIENIRAIKLPAILDLIEFFSRSRSPSVVARAKATFGPKRGAITIAPIITATLSFSIPIDFRIC